MTIQQSLDLATEHHRTGRLVEAAALYQQILQADPQHPLALHLLGVVALQQGNAGLAVELINKAVTSKPDFAEAYGNLAAAYRSLGDLDQAIASLRKALSQNPDNADHDAAHNNLGNALKELGKLDEAVASFRHALAINPDYATAHNNLGTALSALGDLDGAEESYHKALALDPGSAELHNNIGNALKDRGKPDEAVKSFQAALSIKPAYAEAHTNLGNALKDLGKLDAAIESYRQALAINPDFAEAHNNLGIALDASGQLDAAIESYHHALAIDGAFAEAHSNLGNTLKAQGKLVEAVASYDKALAIRPDYAAAYNNLGNVLKELGRHQQAIDSYKQAVALKPDYAEAHSNLIFSMQYCPDMTAADILAEALRWDGRHGSRAAIAPFGNTPDPERKLRIGYVSADFRMHAASFLLEPLLIGHNRDEVEIFCYAQVARPDHVSARLKELSDHWHSSVGLDDDALAALIRADGIDILVDCTGHTAGNRLCALSRKPAPILVNHYIMHGSTSGLAAFDYVLTDPVLSPPGYEDQFSEKVEPLPRGAFAFRPDPQWPATAPPRQATGGPVFACVGDPARIGPQTLTLWARLLDRLPGAHIVFKHGVYGDLQTRQSWQSAFAQLGERASFEAIEGGWGRNMDFYGKVDVILDTLPMSGGTSSLIPLWMGVPLVTMAGGYYCHRSGTAMVTNAGMAEFSADTATDYLQMAVDLINDRQRLDSLRATMRTTMAAAPVLDARGHATDIEAAFRKMWRSWCAEQA